MPEWTVDVESDWGGRTKTFQGIKEAIPKILDSFHLHCITATFFISTQFLSEYYLYVKRIHDAGHTLGSHGHTHLKGTLDDAEYSKELLRKKFGLKDPIPYRAPKFSENLYGSRYESSKNHVGLLKSMWLGIRPKKTSIIYLHPFDIVKPESIAPNLFCKLWYSRPKQALKHFYRILDENFAD